MRTILGVDPGFHVSGYAITQIRDGKVFVIDVGCLVMKSADSLSKRTGQFYQFCADKIVQHSVTEISLETSFLGKNAQTFLKLGFLRGILYLLADQHKLGIAEFAPKQVKATVTGWGGAGKDQVALMMQRLFPKLATLGSLERNDATDALAVALCGAWQKQLHVR